MAIVALLTDFGGTDTYVSEMKAVLMARPSTRLIDITHHIPPYDVEAGAFCLWRSFRYFPKGTWFLAVVDPGVGTERRLIYVRTRRFHFVGPDNGLLCWAIRDCESKEGRAHYFQIATEKTFSATFHGRDLFAPFIRDKLAGRPAKTNPVLTISGSSFPVETLGTKKRRGSVLIGDHFGNAVTSLRACDPRTVSHALVNGRRLLSALNYASIPEGQAALVVGSHGLWEIAARESSATQMLSLKKGDAVVLFLL